jgi:tetratricopeptide (TPR) repeat protein
LCWSSDGKSLIFDRGPATSRWEELDKSGISPYASWDLFDLDLATGLEKPLSRGGGFWSPSMAQEDDLHFLADIKEEGRTPGSLVPRPTGALVHMPLKTARGIMAEQDQERAALAKKWTDFSGRVLKEAGLTSAFGASKLSPETLRKLAEAFARNYATLFKDDPPTTAAALENLRKDLADLDLSAQTETDLQLILGAADGQYLERHLPGTRWLVQPGPLGPTGTSALLTDNPFVLVFNPFRALKPAATVSRGISLAEIRSRVAGRTLVLSNDPTGSAKAVAPMIDPALAQGVELLAKKKGDEADRVLEDLLKRHGGNCRLGLQVAGLLHENGRTRSLERTAGFLEKLSAVFPVEAEAYNLFGLIWMPGKPEKAIEEFKNALRCDLNYGPAYLNLAQAYAQRNDPEAARPCLRRYLKLMPEGDYARDARRRLATLRAEPGGPPNPFGGPAVPTVPPGQPGLSPGGSAAPSGSPVTGPPVKTAPPSSPATEKAPK